MFPFPEIIFWTKLLPLVHVTKISLLGLINYNEVHKMNISIYDFELNMKKFKCLVGRIKNIIVLHFKISLLKWDCHSQYLKIPELENSERKNEILTSFLHDAVGRVQK